MSVMPKTVVAISDEGVRNLYQFFGVPLQNIHKIYNCVEDIHPKPHKSYNGGVVKILYPARINGQKRQLEIVEHLKGKLSDKIKILFAGTGPNYEALQEQTKNDPHFECLGYRSDIYQLLQECDYMMLFSGHEGLPITLIEATMMGCPIICSRVGGNAEIVENEKNGIALDKDDWAGLVEKLNSLELICEDKYTLMCKYNRRIYENRFTFDKFKKEYCKLLDAVHDEY